MARRRPSGQEGLLAVYGVGEKKAGDLGPRFLELIEHYSSGHGLERDVLVG